MTVIIIIVTHSHTVTDSDTTWWVSKPALSVLIVQSLTMTVVLKIMQDFIKRLPP